MKTWFITGASRGFGLRIARLALEQGDNVVATARRAETVIEALGNRERLLALPLDVTNEAQAKAAAAAAVEAFGGIDVLLNNAGFGLLGAVEEASAEDVERVYRTNVFGLLAVTRAVLPHMRHQRSGHILNLSSIGGIAGFEGWGVYCSTKYAVEGLTATLAIELAPLGIDVTAVEPGFFRTDFLDATSLVTSTTQIADYHQTAGAMRGFAADANHAQPGDPAKLAEVLVEFVDTPRPPVRLALGSDTVAKVEANIEEARAMLAGWRKVGASTDFAA
jgi:NAD(P)-dependent dehydrogenase (short-subunit alcohol dehydrogenase family)